MKIELMPGGRAEDVLDLLTTSAAEALAEGVQVEGSELWGRARSQEPIRVEALRELSAEEVAVLRGSSRSVPARSGIMKLRARHHEIARLMASGHKDSEIVDLVGGSSGNLSVLRQSPAFQNLLLSFMAQRDAYAMGLAQQIQQTAALGVDLIQQKLERALEDPEEAAKLNPKFLLETTVAMLDRAGFNPTQKIAVGHVGVTAQTLKELQDATPAVVYDASKASGDSRGPRSKPGEVIDITPALGENKPEAGGLRAGKAVRTETGQGPEEVQYQLL